MEERGQSLGLLHLYCGEGKGKTTAATGLAVRAAGAGKKVLFVQFMKGGATGELAVLRGLSGVKVLRSEKSFPFYEQMTEAQKAELTDIHDQILREAYDAVQMDGCEVLVLDEITYPFSWQLLDAALLGSLLDAAQGHVEVICTGRTQEPFFTERADYITEMRCVRHPFERGITAREGIEY